MESTYGTRLVGSTEDLNSEPEHRRVGLSWDLEGPYLAMRAEPSAGANLAAHRNITDELARHVADGVVKVTFVTPHSTTCYAISSRTVDIVLPG